MTALHSMPRWAQLLLVAILARALTFGNPIVHVDEQFYFVTAHAWVRGALPYVDVWDRKPIGLFLIYLPAAMLGLPLGIWAYQAMALACVVLTALLIARLADRAGWRRGALPAAIAYILWLNFLEGQGGQSPVFYNLLMAGTAWLLAPRPDDAERHGRRLRHGLAAMGVVGLALQIKYSVVFEGLFFGLWWLWREWRLKRPLAPTLGGGAALAALALVPTLVAWGSYAAIGQSQAFLYANFLSIGARRPDPALEQLGNLAQILLITSPLLATAWLAWRRRSDEAAARAMQDWLFAWLLAAAFGFLVFGSYFDHYALPLLVPLAACSAGFLGEHSMGRKIALPLLVVALIGGWILLLAKIDDRGWPWQFRAVADATGRGPGCLYVYSGESMLYAVSGRCRLSRYVFPSHLGRERERGAIGVDQQAEIERILNARPRVVVLRKPYRGERADMRALVMARMGRDYRLKALLPLGDDRISVYALR